MPPDRAHDCPSADDLARMVYGSLEPGHVQLIERHIDGCEPCRLALSGLALGSTARPGGPASDHDGLAPIDPEHYALGDELARGGMGRIFRARDRRLGRDVAIKETFAHGGDARRFEREARITARLQHPSIVQVHEAGVWPTGEPFFAMQLVSGRSLDDAIAAAATFDGRLALVPNVLAVADAIAYAHSQGVIHRDLKPRNVIVGEFGETVVIDWGLAKELTAGDAEPAAPALALGSEDGRTAHGAVIGTPAYMPPEQARGEAVDRRADVYSIGAILYHVLAGRPPIAANAREVVVAAVASGRVPALAGVQPGVPADLLAIVDKAMAFDPAARYADARELALDLRKFQTGQLVGARRYAWPHLIVRWLRRHRTAVAALAAVAVVGAISVQRIVAAEHVAQAERTVAEQSRGDAEDLLQFMLGDLHDKLQPLGKTELLDAVANKALGYYHRRGDDGSIGDRQKRALALSNLGDVLVDEGHTKAGLDQYRAALAIDEVLYVLRPDAPRLFALAAAHQRIGGMLKLQGDSAGALAQYGTAFALATQVVRLEPDDVRARRLLHDAEFWTGGTLTAMGRNDEGLAALREAMAISERVVKLSPSAETYRILAGDHMLVGGTLVNHGDLAAGVAEHRAALDVLQRATALDPKDMQVRFAVLETHMSLGEIFQIGRQDADAATELRAAVATGETVIAHDPKNVRWRAELAHCRADLADSEHALGDDAAAERDVTAALAEQVALAAQDPTAERQHDVEMGHLLLVDIADARGHHDAALREAATVLGMAQQLAKQDSNDAVFRWDLGHAYSRLGKLQLAAGDRGDATGNFRAALAVRRALAATEPANLRYALDVANTQAALGDALAATDPAAALASYREALPQFERAAADGDPGAKKDLDELRSSLAKLERAGR